LSKFSLQFNFSSFIAVQNTLQRRLGVRDLAIQSCSQKQIFFKNGPEPLINSNPYSLEGIRNVSDLQTSCLSRRGEREGVEGRGKK
jgi:hypothetical protein